MSIRLQIVTEKWNPISASIRFTTRSWGSHAEFVDTDLGVTLGARSIGGVRLRDCKDDHYSRVEQFTAANISHAYDVALKQVGKPYDFTAITGMAFDRDWRNEQAWFCSELVVWAFEQVGSPILSTRPSNRIWRITPRDLLMSRLIYYLEGTGVT